MKLTGRRKPYGAAIRLPFRKESEPDEEAPEEDLEEQITKVIREMI